VLAILPSITCTAAAWGGHCRTLWPVQCGPWIVGSRKPLSVTHVGTFEPGVVSSRPSGCEYGTPGAKGARRAGSGIVPAAVGGRRPRDRGGPPQTNCGPAARPAHMITDQVPWLSATHSVSACPARPAAVAYTVGSGPTVTTHGARPQWGQCTPFSSCRHLDGDHGVGATMKESGDELPPYSVEELTLARTKTAVHLMADALVGAILVSLVRLPHIVEEQPQHRVPGAR
jgi:hypothetical protein